VVVIRHHLDARADFDQRWRGFEPDRRRTDLHLKVHLRCTGSGRDDGWRQDNRHAQNGQLCSHEMVSPFQTHPADCDVSTSHKSAPTASTRGQLTRQSSSI
jgi:hypothetical protein